MRRMKLPNGYGSIVKLSGHRRKPFMVRPPVKDWDDRGYPVYDKAIGYYKTWQEAFIALQEYHSDPLDYSKRDMTVDEVFTMALQEKEGMVSENTLKAYRNGYNRLVSLQNAHIRDLRLQHIQQGIDNISGSKSTVNASLMALHLVYDYAMRYEIVSVDYSKRVKLRIKDDTKHGRPFSPEELATLKEHIGDPSADMVLIMCYSGFRVSAFETLEINEEEGYFKGGVKTDAGKGRIVPIHPALMPLLPHYVRGTPKVIRNRLNDAIKRFGLSAHTPHDCRHTFSWLCDQAKMDHLTKQILMGHSRGDLTDSVYGHRTIEELRKAVTDLPF